LDRQLKPSSAARPRISALLSRDVHTVIVPADLTNNPSSDSLSQLLLPIQPEDHVEGDPHARYTLVEYGDYECPACGSLFQTIRQLHAQFGDNIRLVFRHYPLSGIHPHAEQAAEAAEAAAAQGRFWEMHDLLFEHQNALRPKDLYKYSEQLGLDSKRFRDELKDRKYEDRVREDFRRGVANGVYGTPGLFVNGIRHNGELDVASILAKLKEVSP
jgi:protein-disulfide isomerase